MLESLRYSFLIVNRHWTIYRKDIFANILPTLTDPMFFILSIGIGVGAYVNDLHGRPYVAYMAPGLAITTALFTAFFETSYNFYIRYTYEGIFKAMITTPIGVRDIIGAEFIWVAIKGGIMATLVTIVLSLFGMVSLKFIYLIPFVGALVGVACGALGFIATSLVRNINQFQTVYALLISPMFFFSGVFFPISDLPVSLQYVAYCSPLFHGVSISQHLLWGQEIGPALIKHGPFLILFAVVLTFIAHRRIFKMLYS